MRQLRIGAASAALAMLASGVAVAQVTTPAPGTPTTIPEKTAPGTAPATNLDNKSGNLSDKLKDTGGVIRPTGDVDPDMHKPAPQTGTMPVLKPGQVPPQQKGEGGLY